MGSKDRSGCACAEDAEEDAETIRGESVVPEEEERRRRRRSIDGGLHPRHDDTLLPPIPPRLKFDERGGEGRFAVQALDADGIEHPLPPPLPQRAPLLHPAVGTGSPTHATRPAPKPRLKPEAGIHSRPRPFIPRSVPPPPLPLPPPPALPRSDIDLDPLVTGRVFHSAGPESSQLSSRIVLESGRPTAVISDQGFEDDTLLRTASSSSAAYPVVQLSLWPVRSPSSNVHLDSIVKYAKCANEYVDSPTLGPVVTSPASHELTTSTVHGPRSSHEGVPAQVRGRGEASKQPRDGRTKPIVQDDAPSNREVTCKDRIICSRCGRCRCGKCTNGRQEATPQRSIDQQGECSVRLAVDCCTCMCCARAVFYHCSPSEDDDFSDEPCACCDRPRCCARWTALGLLSVCLPCLLCYWPMRCLAETCASCYDGCCRVHGCRCRQDVPLGSKGLLAESESSSY